MDDIIKLYHQLGLKQLEIRACLERNHGIYVSERQLKRRLRYLQLYRRRNYSNPESVADFLSANILTHNQMHGYRWMHLRCLQHGFVVTQETVRVLLQAVDPDGVEYRRRRRLRRRQYYNKGPNYLWHVDSYDKLKPFGICINGCIDGFSRYIIWLKCGSNTSDPAIIASYYLNSVKHLGGCPQTVRSDLGTENGTVETLQQYLREDFQRNERGLPPFIYGTSPHNQRIEAWWSILRKHHAQYWLNIFHNLKYRGLFDGTFLDKSLIQFAFMHIIQEELNEVVMEWNFHIIRGSRNSIAPTGRPFIMFTLPETYDTQDYLHKTITDDLCTASCKEPDMRPCDVNICELCLILMDEERLNMPKSPEAALELYLTLRRKVLAVINLEQ